MDCACVSAQSSGVVKAGMVQIEARLAELGGRLTALPDASSDIACMAKTHGATSQFNSPIKGKRGATGARIETNV